MTTFNAIRIALLGALLGASAAAAQPPDPGATDPIVEAEAIEEVLVTGEPAGPGLWKVRKGDHTLFLLATLSPAPKTMQWRSREVEAVLARAQVFVPARPEVDSDIGPVKAVQLYMQYRKLRGNAEGEGLEAVLPEPLYARFEALRAKYAPRDRSMLQRRPMLAMLELQEAAIDRSGLTFRNQVARTVEKSARDRKVAVVRAEVRIDDPRGTLAELGEIPLQAEIACMEAILGRLESDLATARQRAEAWAVGDVPALRRGTTRAANTCLDSLRNSARMSALLNDFESAWLGVVTRALERHPVTLAVTDIDGLLRPGGLLAQLRARGYEIDEP